MLGAKPSWTGQNVQSPSFISIAELYHIRPQVVKMRQHQFKDVLSQDNQKFICSSLSLGRPCVGLPKNPQNQSILDFYNPKNKSGMALKTFEKDGVAETVASLIQKAREQKGYREVGTK